MAKRPGRAISAKPEKYEMARELYIHERLDLKTIAQRCEMSLGAVAAWRRKGAERGDDWDAARVEGLMASTGYRHRFVHLSQIYLTECTRAVGELDKDQTLPVQKRVELISALGYAMTQMRRAANEFAPEQNKYSIAVEIATDLTRFTLREFPQHAPMVGEVLDAFSAKVIKAYG